MEVGRLEEEAAAESLIPGHGLDDALRRLQRAVDDVREGDRAHRAARRRGEAADRRVFVLRERADGQRRALGELAEPAAQDAAALRQHADRHAERAASS